LYNHLRGTLFTKTPAEAVVEVGGVGYLLTIPLSTYEHLPAEGAEVLLLTTFVVREDAQRLYGFVSEAERAFFNVLRGVSGVGPQVALAIVSSMTLMEFRALVSAGNAALLRRVKGVGKRLSERLVVELKDRLGDVGGDAPLGSADANDRDAVLALEALGFTLAQAEKAVANVRAETPEISDPGDVVRKALRLL
jgi:Holliday junction DNA helicase RuvA